MQIWSILRCHDLFCTHFDMWSVRISKKSTDLSFPDHVDVVLKKSEGKIPPHHGENRVGSFFCKKKTKRVSNWRESFKRTVLQLQVGAYRLIDKIVTKNEIGTPQRDLVDLWDFWYFSL